MLHVGDILSALHGWAPPAIAWERDNVGLLIGRSDAAVSRVLVCLDVTPGIVDEAVRENVQLIVAHHPVIFHPLNAVRTDRTQGAMLAALLRQDINVIALHTNADAARFGLNHALAEALEIKQTRALDPSRGQLRQLTLQMPEDLALAALVKAHLANHEDIAWTSHGLEQNQIAVEIEIAAWRLNALRTELTQLLGEIPHSFREVRIEGAAPGFGIGAVGDLEDAMEVRTFLEMVKDALGCTMLRVSPFEEEQLIRRVAVCSGSGASCISAAIGAGADAIVTGDLTHHVFLDNQSDILLVDAGHYDTERLFIDLCAKQLANMVFENNEKIDILPTTTNTNPIWFE